MDSLKRKLAVAACSFTRRDHQSALAIVPNERLGIFVVMSGTDAEGAFCSDTILAFLKNRFAPFKDGAEIAPMDNSKPWGETFELVVQTENAMVDGPGLQQASQQVIRTAAGYRVDMLDGQWVVIHRGNDQIYAVVN